jgi:3-isopropylmalate dehydrogenase
MLSVALMLEIGFGLKDEAKAVTSAIDKTLKNGYRTGDIADSETDKSKILGTKAMGTKVLEYLAS